MPITAFLFSSIVVKIIFIIIQLDLIDIHFFHNLVGSIFTLVYYYNLQDNNIL